MIYDSCLPEGRCSFGIMFMLDRLLEKHHIDLNFHPRYFSSKSKLYEKTWKKVCDDTLAKKIDNNASAKNLNTFVEL